MEKVTIGLQNQFGEYQIKIGTRTFNAYFDGTFHRCGALRAATAEALATLVQLRVR